MFNHEPSCCLAEIHILEPRSSFRSFSDRPPEIWSFLPSGHSIQAGGWCGTGANHCAPYLLFRSLLYRQLKECKDSIPWEILRNAFLDRNAAIPQMDGDTSRPKSHWVQARRAI